MVLNRNVVDLISRNPADLVANPMLEQCLTKDIEEIKKPFTVGVTAAKILIKV